MMVLTAAPGDVAIFGLGGPLPTAKLVPVRADPG
jgi:hypothetical protein